VFSAESFSVTLLPIDDVQQLTLGGLKHSRFVAEIAHDFTPYLVS
jgi:hypothetical protein